jgi:hypothetical protein
MAGLQDYFTDDQGTYGAFNQGQQRAINQNDVQAQQNFLAQQRPLQLQQQDLANQTTQAGLGSITARSAIDSAGVDDAIAAKKAAHLQTMDDNQLKSFANNGQKLAMIGAAIKNVPPAARVAAFQSMAQQYGIGTDRAADYLNGDPETLPQRLSDTGRDIILSTGDTIKARALNADKDASDERQNKYRTDQALSIAELRAQAQRDAARQKAGNVKPDVRMAQLLAIPADQRNQDQTNEIASLADFIYTQKSLGANQVSPEIVSGKDVTTPAGRTADAAARLSAKPTQAQMTPQGNDVVGTSNGVPVYGIKGRPETYHTK